MKKWNAIECLREAETIDAATTGRVDDDLRAHLARCTVCADLAAVTTALQREHTSAWTDVRVPASGLVWWRMELRARHEAERTATRPIAMAQAFAAACGLVLAAALLASAWPLIVHWLGPEIPSAVADLYRDGGFTHISPATLQWAAPLALALFAWIVFAPLAIYFVLSDN